MRPGSTTAEEYPNTVVHGVRGRCASCKTRYARAVAAGFENPEQYAKYLADNTKPAFTIKVGTPCRHCHRPMRPRKMKRAEAPHTITHRSQLLCETCFEKHGARLSAVDPDRQTHTAVSRGTMQRFRLTQQIPRRPEGLTGEDLANRIRLEDLIRERRKRGIPPEGLLPLPAESEDAA